MPAKAEVSKKAEEAFQEEPVLFKETGTELLSDILIFPLDNCENFFSYYEAK